MPVSAIDFDSSLEVRKTAALSNLQGIRDHIAKKCIETLDTHETLVASILSIKECGLDGLPHPLPKLLSQGRIISVKRFNTLSEEDQVRVILHTIERDKLYQRPANALKMAGLSMFYPLSHARTTRVIFGTSLSDFYLPRLAVIACILLIGIETGWNSEVILSMNAEDVIPNETGYHLVGIKGRTHRRQWTEIPVDPDSDLEADATDRDVRMPRTIRAIKLLLAHQRRIELFADKTDVPLCATLDLKLRKRESLQFHLPMFSVALHEFCDFHNLPRFSFRKLRGLAAHANYLSPEGSIYTVNAFLNHADLGTTSIYLNSTILKSLQAANILRYMKKLAASILFTCGREDIIEKKKIDRKHIDTTLLFPASPMEPEAVRSRIDQWLDSSGDLQLVIGEEEVQHCAIQYHYYKNHFTELANANVERFVYRHLPRIVATIAMRRIIEASRHKAILTEFEEKLDATSL